LRIPLKAFANRCRCARGDIACSARSRDVPIRFFHRAQPGRDLPRCWRRKGIADAGTLHLISCHPEPGRETQWDAMRRNATS
jgi:hypothetical protein